MNTKFLHFRDSEGPRGKGEGLSNVMMAFAARKANVVC